MRFSTQRLEQLLIIGAENTAPAPQEGDVLSLIHIWNFYWLDFPGTAVFSTADFCESAINPAKKGKLGEF